MAKGNERLLIQQSNDHFRSLSLCRRCRNCFNVDLRPRHACDSKRLICFREIVASSQKAKTKKLTTHAKSHFLIESNLDAVTNSKDVHAIRSCPFFPLPLFLVRCYQFDTRGKLIQLLNAPSFSVVILEIKITC